jgi:protein-disulfide isomerase
MFFVKQVIRMSDYLSRRSLLASAAVGVFALALAGCNDNKTEATAPAEPAKPAAEAKPADASKTAEAAKPAADAAKPAVAVEIPKSEGDVDMVALLQPGPLKDIFIGNADAKVTIVEYASMTCPHCKRFHEGTLPAITEKYLNTGKARLVLREFPFDPRAAAAFMLSRCAGDDKYYAMVSALFQQQENWATAEDAKGALLQLSRLAGLSQETFDKCLSNQELLNQVNAVRERATKDFGVNSTPTFFINGKKYSGEQSVEQMSALIDSFL